MIRVLQFADVINRHDVIDTLVQYADPQKFEMSVCVQTAQSNIAKPVFSEATKYRVFEGNSRRHILPTARKLSKLLAEWEIDVLHAHNYFPAVIGWLATRIHPRTKLIFGRHYSDLIQDLPGLKRTFYLGLEQKVNRGANRIIVPSTYIFDILTERQKISRDKIDVISYGFVAEKYTSVTDEQIESVRRDLNLSGRFVVAAFNKLTKGKGVNYLADAVVKLKEKIPNLLMLFVGDGDQQTYIKNLIDTYKLENTIKILGWRTDAMTIMAAADVVVQPTLSEAFSQVMAEAMWFSKPLVVTDVSGATDIIETGENGILVPKADSDALAAAIESLFADRSLREKLSRQGYAYIKENNSIEKKIKDYERSFIKATRSN